jgi:hypothetical protein
VSSRLIPSNPKRSNDKAIILPRYRIPVSMPDTVGKRPQLSPYDHKIIAATQLKGS